jgi:hypothetical protein
VSLIPGAPALLPLDDGYRSFRLQGAVLDQVVKRLPVHQAHVDIQVAVDLAPVVDRDDVRLLQNRCTARFSSGSRAKLFVLRKLVTENLQGDRSTRAVQ